MKYIFIILLFTMLYSKSTLYYIKKYSERWKVDARIMKALIQVESNGKANAISSAKAYGLTQIKLVVAKDYYRYRYRKEGKSWALFWIKAPEKMLIAHIKKESVNIAIGTWNMRQCLNYYNGNYLQALNGYLYGCKGGKDNQGWNYLFKIINEIVNFK